MPSYLPCSHYVMELCHICILVHNLVIFAFCSTNLSYIYIYLKLSQNHILTHIFPQNCQNGIFPQIFLKLQEILPTFQNPFVRCLMPCMCDAFNMFMPTQFNNIFFTTTNVLTSSTKRNDLKII